MTKTVALIVVADDADCDKVPIFFPNFEVRPYRCFLQVVDVDVTVAVLLVNEVKWVLCCLFILFEMTM